MQMPHIQLYFDDNNNCVEVLDAIHKFRLNTSPVNCLEYVLDLSIAVGKVAE